jgi:hypothetical protein
MTWGADVPKIVPKSADNPNDFTPLRTLPVLARETAKTPLAWVSETTGLAGFEPSTYRLGGGRSIHLSYSPE